MMSSGKHLFAAGKCRVDETPKGWFISLIQADPLEEIGKERKAKRDRAERDEEQRKYVFLSCLYNDVHDSKAAKLLHMHNRLPESLSENIDSLMRHTLGRICCFPPSLADIWHCWCICKNADIDAQIDCPQAFCPCHLLQSGNILHMRSTLLLILQECGH